jgi:DNA polymerase-3 subunit epsilon/ATP-dependent DNA helicase DinG
VSRRYVAIDLETTGLDPDRDAIMEVGACRFDLDGRCETFHTLIDPKRAIPYRIQRLTGICQDDVTGAPMFAEVAGELEAFIGQAPVIGQNVAFDLDFLDRSLVRPPGPAYDTQDLASMLLPGLLEHNLLGIARHLGIEFPVQHRALADAEAARLVFLALRARLAALPPALLAEAARIASVTDWPLRHLLLEVSDEHAGNGRVRSEVGGLLYDAVRPPQKYGPAVRASDATPAEIDAVEVALLLTHAARDVLEGFEEREEQVTMARAVAGALNRSESLLVEAGTGIGKSLAYLLPAARFALENDTRVVVSTNTLNLQEQIMSQDVPSVQRMLPNGERSELRAAQLKGRRNYLCLLRWSNLRRSPSLSADEAKLLVRLLLWLPHTETGDRAELRLSQGEEPVWARLNAQNEACLAVPCAFVRDGSCFLLRARRRAEAAHLLVVNHALVLSDIAVGGGVIPEYRHLIVDEAHHLEDEATRQFGFHANEDDLRAFVDRISSRNSGLTASLRNSVRGAAAGNAGARDAVELAGRLDQAASRARTQLPEFFLRLAGFVRQQSERMGDYDDRLLLSRAMRVQPDWADVELVWENLSAALADLASALHTTHVALQSPDAQDLLDRDSLVSETWELAQTGAALRQGVTSIVLSGDGNTICWLTYQRSGSLIGLASAPLRVADLLEERLHSQKDTVVLTSATLTVEGRFDYVRQAVGLPEADELLLGSPFDYARSTIVLVPRDMPEPNHSDYMAALQQALIDLTRATRGRALVLFTSHSSLRAAHAGIKRVLEEEEILVLGHNIDGSPRQLLQALREHPQTVVLGTASFWEGIDVVGDALSLLVMARLPFSVPDDPIFQSRSELYEDAFGQYAVPQAVLRFKQGFGRLIRRKTDRGAMVVLDSRIATKSYGQSFLRSLPPCNVQRLRLVDMPQTVASWIDSEG